MRNDLKVPYGYNYFTIGTITVYTAKIRVKADIIMFEFMYNSVVDSHPVLISNHKNDCIAISWSTTDYIVHNMYRELVNTKLASIMHARIDSKYARHTPEYTCL